MLINCYEILEIDILLIFSIHNLTYKNVLQHVFHAYFFYSKISTFKYFLGRTLRYIFNKVVHKEAITNKICSVMSYIILKEDNSISNFIRHDICTKINLVNDSAIKTREKNYAKQCNVSLKFTAKVKLKLVVNFNTNIRKVQNMHSIVLCYWF